MDRIPVKLSLLRLGQWLPATTPLRMLDIGCGTAEETGGQLASGTVTEFVGVDLDETAIIEARARWPGAKFICADAARLGPEYTLRFDAVLLRRPDLLAQPGRWRQVFKRLPTLLQAEGRVLLTLFGMAEASVAHGWLTAEGLRVLHTGWLPQPDEPHLMVAEACGEPCPEPRPERSRSPDRIRPLDSAAPASPPIKLIQLGGSDGEGPALPALGPQAPPPDGQDRQVSPAEGMICDPLTGECLVPDRMLPEEESLDDDTKA